MWDQSRWVTTLVARPLSPFLLFSCFERATGIAMAQNNGEIFGLFLKAGCNPNECIKASFGGMRTDGARSYYAIHNACEAGANNVVRTLLECGANPNVKRRGTHHPHRPLRLTSACRLVTLADGNIRPRSCGLCHSVQRCVFFA